MAYYIKQIDLEKACMISTFAQKLISMRVTRDDPVWAAFKEWADEELPNRMRLSPRIVRRHLVARKEEETDE